MRNQRVLITGGSSGLGRALALELAGLGARVAVVSRGAGSGTDAAAFEGPLRIRGDVSAKEDIHRIAGEAHARLGGIDVLINNASYLGATPLRLLLDTECEDFGRVLETNLLGPFRLTKAVLPGMLLRGRGTVLNISSDAALNPYPRWGAYSASKAALAHLSRIWAEELREKGVRFLAVDPGDMNTPMHHAAVPDADLTRLLDPRDAAHRLIGLLASGVVCGRPALPDGPLPRTL